MMQPMVKKMFFLKFIIICILLATKIYADKLPACGSHELEKGEEANGIYWTTALNLDFKSRIFKTKGVVCAGLSKKKSGIVMNIVFRDNKGFVERIFDYEELKTAQTLLKRSDFPFYYFLLKMRDAYAKLQLIKEDKINNFAQFRLIFLRNLGGAEEDDFRYIDFYASLDNENNTIKVKAFNKEIGIVS